MRKDLFLYGATVAMQAPPGSPFPIVQPDIYKTADWLADHGFDSLELHVQRPDLVNGVTLKEHCDNRGLRISTIGTGMAYSYEGLTVTTPEDSVRAKAIQRLREQINLASVLGCAVVIGSMRGGLAADEDIAAVDRRMVEGMKPLCEYAEAKNVDICVEALNRYETRYLRTGEDVLELIEKVGSKRLLVHLDSYHMNIEEADMAGAILRCGAHLGHFHACDSNRCYPGSGHIDFKPILEALRTIGYRRNVTLEILPVPDGFTAVQRGLAHLKQL
ncbi:sugar phosphate isomerase/epimerase family protein [uncultured Oscillibacter sp.]|uniref:sugar phosphate isomerase/epimerase family protein n=1 Tax=uncultured Oscillibacter sp. TaxID=876091 RepID=UPI0028042E7E|nr:sugar phosphate isomerase/epimerase family protein [uncultured Oscillibacter sp.]